MQLNAARLAQCAGIDSDDLACFGVGDYRPSWFGIARLLVRRNLRRNKDVQFLAILHIRGHHLQLGCMCVNLHVFFTPNTTHYSGRMISARTPRNLSMESLNCSIVYGAFRRFSGWWIEFLTYVESVRLHGVSSPFFSSRFHITSCTIPLLVSHVSNFGSL